MAMGTTTSSSFVRMVDIGYLNTLIIMVLMPSFCTLVGVPLFIQVRVSRIQ
jgi:hypothetical protein